VLEQEVALDEVQLGLAQRGIGIGCDFKMYSIQQISSSWSYMDCGKKDNNLIEFTGWTKC
jgi:hypothetical protein